MRVRGVTAITTTIAVVGLLGGLLGGCGSDPQITVDGSAKASAADAVGGVDLSKASFVDLSSEDAPTVEALDNVFKAKYVTVKAGTTITFTNDGRNIHNVIPVDEASFKAVEAGAFDAGTTVEITFDKPGDHPYYCSLHGTTTKGMTGAVRVLQG